MKSDSLTALENKLFELAPDKRAALAFSGGVDSTVLLTAAVNAGFEVLAVTFDTKLTSTMISISKACEYAEQPNVTHVIVSIDVMADERIKSNSEQRCYYCKSLMFSALKETAEKHGFSVLLDGTNADDLREYRPGLSAKDEQGVKSPFALCGLTKEDVRSIGKELGTPIYSKPSSPCLLTRFQYNTEVTGEMLEAVEQGEQLLANAGFESSRLRVHASAENPLGLARIEIPKDRFSDFLQTADDTVKNIKQLGFLYVTLDTEGLRSGSTDKALKINNP